MALSLVCRALVRPISLLCFLFVCMYEVVGGWGLGTEGEMLQDNILTDTYASSLLTSVSYLLCDL